MVKTTILKFAFTTPLHIGTVRADYSISNAIIHSDTLYAAVMQAWSMLGKEEWIPKKNQWQDLGFSISSLFPYYTVAEENDPTNANRKPIYFFPKPYGFLNDKDVSENDKPESKQFKKVQYYDAHYFLKFLKNEKVDGNYSKHVRGAYLTVESAKENEPLELKFMQKQVYPKVRVARTAGKDAVPYYIERIYFQEHSGLFAIVKYDTEEDQKRFYSALNLLADEGLGTDRHVGNGSFKYSVDNTFFQNFKMPSESNYALNLSLFCPESKESLESMISDDLSRYEIVQRGGWVTAHPYMSYRKKSVNMFREGGIFRFTVKELTSLGTTHDLAPEPNLLPKNKALDHPVWRCGKSLFVPVNFNFNA